MPVGLQLDPQDLEGHWLWTLTGEPLQIVWVGTNLASIWEQIGTDVVRRPSWREAGRLHCHPFVINKRDGGSWDLGGNGLFLLPRLSEFYVLM